MTAKTNKGKYRKEITDDGREDVGKWIDRETNLRKQTKTKIKRAKKAQEKLKNVHKFP